MKNPNASACYKRVLTDLYAGKVYLVCNLVRNNEGAPSSALAIEIGKKSALYHNIVILNVFGEEPD